MNRTPAKKANVEPGNEEIRNLRKALEGKAQGNHKGDDEIAVEGEGFQDGGLGVVIHIIQCAYRRTAREHEPEPD